MKGLIYILIAVFLAGCGSANSGSSSSEESLTALPTPLTEQSIQRVWDGSGQIESLDLTRVNSTDQENVIFKMKESINGQQLICSCPTTLFIVGDGTIEMPIQNCDQIQPDTIQNFCTFDQYAGGAYFEFSSNGPNLVLTDAHGSPTVELSPSN